MRMLTFLQSHDPSPIPWDESLFAKIKGSMSERLSKINFVTCVQYVDLVSYGALGYSKID